MAGPTSTIIRGTVVVTDSLGVLEEAVRTGAPSAKWLSKTIWLVDGRAGPEPDNSPIAKPPVALDFLEQRFEAAITRAWGRRIDTRKTEPVTIEFDFTTIQARWVGFLKKMEPEYPGIVGSARNLLARSANRRRPAHSLDSVLPSAQARRLLERAARCCLSPR